MPVERKCSFCGTTIKPGFGRMHVLNDGTILYFCSSKCFKNALKLKRKPDKVVWVKKLKKKEEKQ